MRWVEFDVDVAQALAQRCQAAAEVMRAQGYWRRNAVENALEDFHGTYSMLFADASRLESEDRVRLAQALDDVAEQVHNVIAAAEREEDRRERAFQASVRAQEGDNTPAWALGDPFF